MERTKRKNVFRAELIIFLAIIAVSLLVLWIRWENSHATYKNYDIVVKKNVYCEKTQTGRVDLQIRRKGGKKAKLLQTQQELKQSQSFQIVEDSYKLGIVDDASARPSARPCTTPIHGHCSRCCCSPPSPAGTASTPRMKRPPHDFDRALPRNQAERR